METNRGMSISATGVCLGLIGAGILLLLFKRGSRQGETFPLQQMAQVRPESILPMGAYGQTLVTPGVLNPESQERQLQVEMAIKKLQSL